MAGERFRTFAFRTAAIVGSHWSFLVAVLVVVVWAATGPLFHFSDTWQLIINTGTTVVTFLMVFLIQASQNRDGRAVQLKLDELIRAQRLARNVFADIEDASEEELDRFHKEFKELRRKGLPTSVAAAQAAERIGGEPEEDGLDAAQDAVGPDAPEARAAPGAPDAKR